MGRRRSIGFAAGRRVVNLVAFAQLAAATVSFVVAATVAKAWAVSPGWGKLLLALALYTAGNLVMLRLIRLLGMATAFSLSAVAQLVAVNAVALVFYGERLGITRSIGVALAVIAVALITLGPASS